MKYLELYLLDTHFDRFSPDTTKGTLLSVCAEKVEVYMYHCRLGCVRSREVLGGDECRWREEVQRYQGPKVLNGCSECLEPKGYPRKIIESDF